LGIERQGLAMRLGRGDGSAAALVRNQLTLWSSRPFLKIETGVGLSLDLAVRSENGEYILSGKADGGKGTFSVTVRKPQ
jgi:hypothetical protein